MPRPPEDPRQPNRLAAQKSPYLLQHAFNPVDWYPWGEEAFARARQEDKPIFLSVGYATCHWCHVMERESFENTEIADAMNAAFINVKVDREERPDVDRIYMAYVQATTGHGGWPMSVWLTPSLHPFFGGTYFPPEPRHHHPGFPALIERIAQAWKEDRARIEEVSGEIIGRMAQLNRAAHPADDVPPDALLNAAYATLQSSFDPRFGGFGYAPKFPRPVSLNFLARHFARSGAAEACEMLLTTLREMAKGGMADQLGGGFHRYSVDAQWHVPHFEKMLYDQAQLLRSYLEGYQICGDEALADVARGIVEYVLRDLTDEETGAFYSAEDADSAVDSPADREGLGENADHQGEPVKREGAFYVWTAAELTALLQDDAEAFAYHYGVEPEGNAHGHDPHGELDGQNVLHRVHTVAETAECLGSAAKALQERLERCRARLLEARNRRPRPGLDDKVLCAWNGLMISALARASQVLGEPRYLAAAERAARFVMSTLYDAERRVLLRRYRDGQAAFDGYLEDYAFVVEGLIDLYEASFDLSWLQQAEALNERCIELFYDEETSGFFSTTGADNSILVRLKDDHDGAEPAGSSIATINLLRLAAMIERPEWAERARQTLRGYAWRLREMPEVMPQMLVALDLEQHPPVEIVIAGERQAEDTSQLLATIHSGFAPNKLLLLADDALKQAYGARLPHILPMKPLEGRAAAYICQDHVCQAPSAGDGVLQFLQFARQPDR